MTLLQRAILLLASHINISHTHPDQLHFHGDMKVTPEEMSHLIEAGLIEIGYRTKRVKPIENANLATLESVRQDLIQIIARHQKPLLFKDPDGSAYLVNGVDEVIRHQKGETLISLTDLTTKQLLAIAESPITPWTQPNAPWSMDFDDLWALYFSHYSKPHTHNCTECDHQKYCTDIRCTVLPLYRCDEH